MAEGFAQRIETGDLLLGSFHDFIDPALIEIVGYAGFDFVCLEYEHGLRDFGTLQHLIRAAQQAGLFTLVRISGNDLNLIERLLDGGADGVSVAHVKTVEQARAIVSAAKYPPEGVRGEGYSRRNSLWRFGPTNRDWQKAANRRSAVFFIIEDPEGVANIEGICRVPGLSGIVPGPGDLANALGESSLYADSVQNALRRVRDSVIENGLALLEFVVEKEHAKVAYENGARLIMYGHDVILIGDLYDQLARDTREFLGVSGDE
jgi:2-keto-3-deoxy-L-rhamnonate aldolase RhmA